MSFPIIVRPLAERDLLEAQRWYEGKNPGLGEQFRRRIDDVLEILSETPLVFRYVHHDVRRAAVKVFPYIVYYVVRRQRVLVLGCFHARRDPRVILRRIGRS
ncbi:MAG TPA: type II toxin-antitoxin system RelE/ParE family toxin [Thermoanaerobaculia bacterium]|nr:type II toxin-antitoxin system RelE/ParE family toxin [Thermoanaerobaculia bacterium]